MRFWYKIVPAACMALALVVLSACGVPASWNFGAPGETVVEGDIPAIAVDTPTASPSPAPPAADTSNPAAVLSEGSEGNLYAATLQELGEAWARAYCRRDADTLYGLCHDKELFFDIGGYVSDDGEQRGIGLSSPWPWYEEEARVFVDGDEVDYTLYWRTSTSVSVQRLTLLYARTEIGYQVAGVEIPYSSVSSKAAFDYTYAHGLPPLDEYADAFQAMADADPETWSLLFDPAAATAWQLTVEDAETTWETRADGSAQVAFTWADGSVVVAAEQPKVKGENGVWVVLRKDDAASR